MTDSENTKKSQKNDTDQTFSALRMSLELGYVIAIPIVVLALAGRLLDKQFGTQPWLLLAGIILSIVISSIGLVMKFSRILKRITPSVDEHEDQKPPKSELK